jgi:hypothetical protein
MLWFFFGILGLTVRSEILEVGFWILGLDFGFGILDLRRDFGFDGGIRDFRCWVLDCGFGFWIWYFGFWVGILGLTGGDPRFWVLGSGFWVWILDLGVWIRWGDRGGTCNPPG